MFHPRQISIGFLLLALSLPAAAQYGPGPTAGPRSGVPTRSAAGEDSTRIKPSYGYFIRPSRENPTAQLAYARELEADGRRRAANRAYRALVKTWPTSPEAPKAQFAYARMLDEKGKTSQAVEEYEYLLQEYVAGFPHQEVFEKLYAMGRELLDGRRARLFFGGFKAPERAIPIFQTIVSYGPHWEKAPEAQYLIGVAHERNKDYELAIPAYDLARARYPDSPWAEHAAFQKTQCLYLLSQESPNSERLVEDAWLSLVLFMREYRNSEHMPTALAYRDALLARRAWHAFERASFYDRIARKPAAALRAYEDFAKRFPDSEWAPIARTRIEALIPEVGASKDSNSNDEDNGISPEAPQRETSIAE